MWNLLGEIEHGGWECLYDHHPHPHPSRSHGDHRMIALLFILLAGAIGFVVGLVIGLSADIAPPHEVER